MKNWPKPDRQYLQTLEVIDYYMKLIRLGLDMDSIEPNPSFRSVCRQAQYLAELIKVAAIAEDRQAMGLIIKYPTDDTSK